MHFTIPSSKLVLRKLALGPRTNAVLHVVAEKGVIGFSAKLFISFVKQVNGTDVRVTFELYTPLILDALTAEYQVDVLSAYSTDTWKDKLLEAIEASIKFVILNWNTDRDTLYIVCLMQNGFLTTRKVQYPHSVKTILQFL